MAFQGVPEMDVDQSCRPVPGSGDDDRLARRDLFLLRLEAARRRRRSAATAGRTRSLRPVRLAG